MTQSSEDYLEAIYNLSSDGEGAAVRAVASRLGVKMPSVVKAVRDLKRMELVEQEPYGLISLTAEGRRLASDIQKRHQLLRGFLEALGVSGATADRDACLMEHILSAESIDRIRFFLSKKTFGTSRKPKKGDKTS